jgi:transcriptional regulator of acetoin/glycerol metabolism
MILAASTPTLRVRFLVLATTLPKFLTEPRVAATILIPYVMKQSVSNQDITVCARSKTRASLLTVILKTTAATTSRSTKASKYAIAQRSMVSTLLVTTAVNLNTEASSLKRFTKMLSTIVLAGTNATLLKAQATAVLTRSSRVQAALCILNVSAKALIPLPRKVMSAVTTSILTFLAPHVRK